MLSKSALRRVVQAFSLAVFLVLLVLLPPFCADFFLRLDPLAGLLAPVVGRTFIATMLPAIVVIISAFFVGRAFCGWICPMGSTLAAAGTMLRRCLPKRKYKPGQVLAFILLAAMGLTALCGLNIYFWGSPIALATRLYGFLLEPLATAIAANGLNLADPLLRATGYEQLAYIQLEPRAYQGIWFVAAFWLLLFLLELLAPRFWCRSLCPAGAILSLCSRFPFLRRATTSKCVSCGKCSRICPMGAIEKKEADSRKCILCGNCADVCHARAVKYAFSMPETQPSEFESSRRAFCMGTLTAGAIAGASLIAGPTLHAAPLVRPPGSRPEADFLARCLRCGECMVVCPDHALQPVTGMGGIFSPFIDPYSGGCDPDCCLCGQVCPTQAIIRLPLEQKRWAKIGTAAIDRTTCLAWGHDKRCMVCKENCPYDAIRVITKDGYTVPVPLVNPAHCYGCGFCQKACPVKPAAIVVEPTGALRLDNGDYAAAAKAAGLDISSSRQSGQSHGEDADANSLPPGFTN